MDKYLDNYILASSSTQKVRIGELLDEIKVSKTLLPKIIKSFEDYGQDAPVALSYSEKGTTANFGPVEQSMRDARQAIARLYDMSNDISIVLENSAYLLESEVAALEDDLIAMEKAVDNYGFLMGGSNAYNFSYLETFSDDTGRDVFDECPDRASLGFGPAQKAAINVKEGTLVLPKDVVRSYDLRYRILATNAPVNATGQPIATTNAMGDPAVSVNKAWRSTVESPAPLTTTIHQAKGYKGAQVLVEYTLSSAAPASEINIEPFADTPIQLVQVTTYKSAKDTEGENLMVAPVLLDSPKTLHFPMRSVYKVELVLNQPTYNRVTTATTTEDEYRQAYESLQARLKDLKDKLSYNRSTDFNHLLWLVLCFLQGNNSNIRPNPKYMPSQYVGAAGIPALIEAIKRNSRPPTRLGMGGHGPHTRSGSKTANPYDNFDIEQFVTAMFQKKDELYDFLAQREISLFEQQLARKGIYDPKGVLSPIQMIYQNGWVYRYALGLQKVAIGVGSSSFRGFHITKPLDSSGDIGEISIRSQHTNYRSPELHKDNSVMTSVEFSVSNQSNPMSESDWIPILPVGSTIVEAERLYPDSTGRCALRFPANVSSVITVYRNNATLELPTDAFEYDSQGQSVRAFRIPVSDYTPEDILSVTYVPAADYTNISFANYGFDLPPLTNAYDESGAGEAFASTSGNNEISLKNDPYIDAVKADASPYSNTFGMTTYQPITVKLTGGETAINLTNYSKGEQAALPSSGYYFVQSGRTIIFNKAITQPFRVYYQYLQNNVRVRTVLRCDTKNFVTPKVDSLQIKGKTRRPNRRGLL